jgi:membrane fusion protein (multidrug efflux system)
MSLSCSQAESSNGGGHERPAKDGPGEDRGGAKKPSPLKNPLVRLALIVLGIVLLILFALWFFHYWTRGRFVQETNDAYLQADQVSVSTRVSAFVDAVNVADNQSVTAGQPLVRLNPRDCEASVAKAAAQEDQARATIDQAQAQIHQQETSITQSQAQLLGARAQAVYYEVEANRYRPLAAAGAETHEKLDQMVQSRDQAGATVKQDTAAVEGARRQIAIYKTQIEQAQAQVEQARAQKASAQVDLDATLVRASVSGRIGDKTVRVGQFVPAGTNMMTVVPIDALYLIANFKETQIGLMRVGQPVSIKVDALEGETLHGVVESFSPGTGSQFALIPPNNATGNFTKIVQRVPVRIRVQAGPEAGKILAPGFSATVAVDTFGAKSDAEEEKQENKAKAGAERRETQQQLDADKRFHAVGAGAS